jgi:CheY-like chemotaxis protein
MDIQMPVMDGLTATRAIRSIERARGSEPTPIVALTANAGPQDVERSRQAGCNSHLSEVVQVVDTITPGNPHYNEKSRLAKTILKDGQTWGSATSDDAALAHANSRMTCYACHTSWTTSCFGCHLPLMANKKTPMLHNEGLTTRNYTSYNFEVLRDDVYMLGIDSTVTNHRIAPTRSTCAVVVSSQNANRDWLYYNQQTHLLGRL